MILCAGLTPAWQQTLVFDHFRLGEVNRAAQVAWCAAGKVLNAAIAVHCLGEPALALATLGGEPLTQIDREFDDLGIARRWIVSQSATRVCTTVLDRGTGSKRGLAPSGCEVPVPFSSPSPQVTELVENGRPLLPGELDEFRAAYAEEAARAEVAIISGSLPGGTSAGFYRDLLARTPCPAILDFRGEGLLACLDLQPYLVKPNREELGHTMGRALTDDGELLAAMRELNRRGAQWVVITQGAGPVWITSLSQTYRLDPLPVAEVVNPIGCGDALTAGIACALRRGQDVIEGVRLGIAAAAASLGNLLPARFGSAGVEEQAGKIRVEIGSGDQRR